MELPFTVMGNTLGKAGLEKSIVHFLTKLMTFLLDIYLSMGFPEIKA